MKVFLLPEQLGQVILNYLAKQPYGEVAPMVGGIMNLKEAPPLPLACVPKEKGEPEG